MSRSSAILVAARRTPIGRVGRSLKDVTVERLAAPVLQAVLHDAKIAPADVDEVILGNAIGAGGNPARLAVLAAGFPDHIPGLTIDRQCGSGLEAINLAARLIESGAAEVVIAGGVESVSTAPWRIEKPKSLYELPRFTNRARFAPDAIGDPDMGAAAEAIAQRFGICRDRQDQYAAYSHQKAIAAQQSGRFQTEMTPIALSSTTIIDRDDCPRSNLTIDRLAKLPPVFVEGGTITVGNACPVNDGAAVVLLVSEQRFQAMKLTRGLRIVDAAAAGVDPNLPGLGPIAATQKLLQRQALAIADIDIIEFNEAFAAQVLACLDALEIPESTVNVGGGAIALGHPYGASGAILVTRLFTEMIQAPTLSPVPRLGLATIGIGGGLGISTLFDRVF